MAQKIRFRYSYKAVLTYLALFAGMVLLNFTMKNFEPFSLALLAAGLYILAGCFGFASGGIPFAVFAVQGALLGGIFLFYERTRRAMKAELALYLFLAATLFFWLFGAFVYNDYLRAAIVAAVIFIYKERPRAFGYRKTSWKYFLIAIALQFGLLFSLDKVNSYFLELLELIGYSGGMSDASSLPSMAGAGIVGALAVVAVLPAFLEESIFRGVMLEGMKALGTAAACLLGGLCFSLFHQNPEQTIYQFICGAAFTLLAIRADSLLPAVAAHLLNNAFIVLELRFSFLQHVPLGGEIAIYVLSALSLVGSLVWLLFFDKRGNTKGQVPCKAFVKPALPGIIVCAVMWVYVFVVGVL